DARDRAADRPGADGRDSAHGGTTGDIEALSMWAGLGGVTSEQAGQFFRAAECRAVASGDLIGNDAQALGGHAAHEPSREEAVLGTQDEPGGYGGPGAKRPRAAPRRIRLRPESPGHGLVGEGARNVMEEADKRIMATGLAAVSRGLRGDGRPQAGVGGPVLRPLPRRRDHAGDQDDRASL